MTTELLQKPLYRAKCDRCGTTEKSLTDIPDHWSHVFLHTRQRDADIKWQGDLCGSCLQDAVTFLSTDPIPTTT